MPRLSTAQKAAIAAGEAEVLRQQATSKQPRFDPRQAYIALTTWLRVADLEAPPYRGLAASMKRDAWLRNFWRKEPHLAGVINQVTAIDANRGWELVGGRNQVARYTDMLHGADVEGWRSYMRRSSLSFWATDMGSITEIGRDGQQGPMRALWHVDSARCYLTGLPDKPLDYQPATGGLQHWQPGDYFRTSSLPSDDEAFHGLGFCAVSRALEIVRLLYAVMVHDQEQVAARAPKGLLLLQGITQDQWDTAMAAREENLNGLEREYYGGVAVLASMAVDQVDAKLVALSQLPANFDAEQFTNGCMYGIALCFGYDPSEFWPVQFGSLGRGTETEVQHMKASGKGGTEFALGHQERLQRELPATLHFEYEQRDDQGELALEAVKQAKEKTITEMYNAGTGFISMQEARQLAAEQGLIPPEWTLQEEEVTTTDTDAQEAEAPEAAPEPGNAPAEPAPPAAAPVPPVQQARLMEAPEVQRAVRRWPGQEIVRYRWPANRLEVVWMPRRIFRGHRVQRSDVLYQGEDFSITESDVDAAIAAARKRVGDEFADLLKGKPYEAT